MKLKNILLTLLFLSLLGLSAYCDHLATPQSLGAAMLHTIGRNLYAPLIGILAWVESATFHKDPAVVKIHRGLGAFLLLLGFALMGLELYGVWKG